MQIFTSAPSAPPKFNHKSTWKIGNRGKIKGMSWRAKRAPGRERSERRPCIPPRRQKTKGLEGLSGARRVIYKGVPGIVPGLPNENDSHLHLGRRLYHRTSSVSRKILKKF